MIEPLPTTCFSWVFLSTSTSIIIGVVVEMAASGCGAG